MRIAVLGPLEVRTDDGAAGDGAGRQGAPAPGPAGRRVAGRRQHRPHRRDAVEREPSAERAEVTAGPPRAAAQRARARPRHAARPAATSSGAAPATRWRQLPTTSMPCTSVDLAARGRALLASGDAAEAARLLSSRTRPVAGRTVRRLAGRRRSPTRSGGGSPRSAPARSPRCSRPAWRWGSTPTVVAEAERLLADDPLQEEWWRLLVLALYRCGRQGDALAAVGRARAVLVGATGRRARSTAPGGRGGGPRPGPGAGPGLATPEPPSAGCRRLPVQGTGHLSGCGRRAVPRPEPAGHPAGGTAGRRSPARGVRRQRRRQVLARPGRPRTGARRRRPAGQRRVAGRRRDARPHRPWTRSPD